MAKVYRLHSSGGQEFDWFSSGSISTNLIDSITAEGGDGKKLPTSIPSPFARIDLVRSAFKTVAAGDLDGVEFHGKAHVSDNHKLVSDALDIAQIFFNFSKCSDDLKLVAWDIKSGINRLKESTSEGHRHLGKTLELFLNQDRDQYNFNLVDNFYILFYKNRIIGGTSPKSLFFAAPDAQATSIQFGEDVMLDDHLLPLYRRDPRFIKYLYSLSKKPGFANYFSEITEYLYKTKNRLEKVNNNLFLELGDLNADEYLRTLKPVLYNDNAGHPLEIISGIPVLQYIKNPAIIEKESEFVIQTEKEVQGLKPLVLPVDQLNQRYKYTEGYWVRETKVPRTDLRPLHQRTLPGQGDKYPYLTVDDFLEDTIIELPVKYDAERFLNVGSKKHLLPLKELFFSYFSPDDILDKEILKIDQLAGGGVEVKLSIPISNGSRIYYSKQYVPDNSQFPHYGRILRRDFSLSVYPFLKCEQIRIEYAVGLVYEKAERAYDFEIEIFNSNLNTRIQTLQAQRSSSSELDSTTIQTYMDEAFDIIVLKTGDARNVVIPKLKKVTAQGGDIYEFGIDFGTTNTHIEYKISNQGSERAFDIVSRHEEQIVFLFKEEESVREQALREMLELQNLLKQEAIDSTFGEGVAYQSPFRTCLIENKKIDYNTRTEVFTHANIGFDYEFQPTRSYLRSQTNLKWADDNNGNKRAELFIQEALMLCKNKVLLNNGNLGETKVTWFYPVSMSSNQIDLYRRIWDRGFRRHFFIDKNEDISKRLKSFPESIAPMYYYKHRGGINAADRPSVSIDIGGGTTDVLIYANGVPEIVSSFRFAGNSIFGNGFNGNIKSNGFITKYLESYFKDLEDNNLKKEKIILDHLYDSVGSSEDLISFLFSLSSNKTVKQERLDSVLDFTDKLSSDSDLKIVFLLFYMAIIYHIAELLKIRNMRPPRNILFSGTASKSMKILEGNSGNSDNVVLSELFQRIFAEVMEIENFDLSVSAEAKPKEITAKGSFYVDDDLKEINFRQRVCVNIGSRSKPQLQNPIFPDDESLTLDKVDRIFLDGVQSNVDAFHSLFDRLNQKMNFEERYGISNHAIQVYKSLRSKDQMNDLLTGLEKMKKANAEKASVGETFFFYPFIGLFYKLAASV